MQEPPPYPTTQSSFRFPFRGELIEPSWAGRPWREARYNPVLYSRAMKFKVLQDNLRQTLRSRIKAGELTGLRLAKETGFKQAHISNFLNRKRGLSIEGMDKVLKVQALSVLDQIGRAHV